MLAEQINAVNLASLRGDFATVAPARDVLESQTAAAAGGR
jgi:hypothetical protein